MIHTIPLLAAAEVIDPTPWMILPFAVMLLCIAVMPFIHAHWWERNYHYVAIGLGTITTVYYVAVLGHPHRIVHVAEEYVSFIALIGSLFIIAGGIHIQVKGESTPLTNCIYLLVGAVTANLVGTTGASMLLIRPWIRSNRYRITSFHIVFFIFIVSNVGGCLTPIGDPPLFLGYLKGVPFFWVLKHCWAGWLVAVFGLIAIFYVFDRRNFLRAPREIREIETGSEVWAVHGKRNLLFLVVVLGAVFINHPRFLREALMIGAAVASYLLTPNAVHKSNEFSFHPLKEVAWLFVGIFATMVPALDYLEHNAGYLAIDSEMKFYWLTGMLSAVLDNAPTYLTFLAAAFGRMGLSMDNPPDVHAFLQDHGHFLVAISLGAVFFGAMTYIGNGPNFLVKAIAQHARVSTPSFFGYIVRFSLPILLPFLFIVSLVFFSRWRLF